MSAHKPSFEPSLNRVGEVPQQEEPSESINRPTSRRKWKPSAQAYKTAVTEILHHLDKEDLGLITARYELICHEKRKPLDSGEWLRWVIEDERRAKEKFQATEREKAKRKPWHYVDN